MFSKISTSLMLAIVVLTMVTTNTCYAQVSGISSSKIGVICSGAVPTHKLEFDPSFLYSYSSEMWDKEGKTQYYQGDKDKILTGMEYGFRLTYGVAENIEAGAFLPADLSGFSLGGKYNFLNLPKNEFAVIAGINVNSDNKEIFRRQDQEINQTHFGGGLVYRRIFKENFTWDTDIQYQKAIVRGNDDHTGDLFLNSELGYYFGSYQICTGFAYMNSMNEIEDNKFQILSFLIGGTIETAENFLIVWGIPIDVYGKNIEKSVGFTMAFTMTIN